MILETLITLVLGTTVLFDKSGGDEDHAWIYFRCDHSEYEASYLENQGAVASLEAILREAGLERIASVDVVAYASPEGSLARNIFLSRARAEALRPLVEERLPECVVHNVFIDPKDPKGIESRLREFFAEHPAVRHIATFNSRIHLITGFLEKNGMQGLRVVGFDNLPANLDALRKDTVNVLITQHPDEQAASAIRDLVDHVVFKKTPPRRDNFMHMDILTRYNVEYY